jgi:hypothetical protein
MHLKLPTSLLILILSSSFTTLPSLVLANDAASGLYPSNLQPLITRANVLLSAGQFGDAAKAYSEVLGQSRPFPPSHPIPSLLSNQLQRR